MEKIGFLSSFDRFYQSYQELIWSQGFRVMHMNKPTVEHSADFLRKFQWWPGWQCRGTGLTGLWCLSTRISQCLDLSELVCLQHWICCKIGCLGFFVKLGKIRLMGRNPANQLGDVENLGKYIMG